MNKKTTRKARSAILFILCALLSFPLLFLSSTDARGSICAEVKIEIRQELTLERQAFDAHMRINNGLEIPLNNVNVDVNFTDEDGNAASANFFIRVDTMDGITGGQVSCGLARKATGRSMTQTGA